MSGPSSPREKLFLSLYFDSDVAAPIANILRNRGFDVVCTHEAGKLEVRDDDQLVFAVSQGRGIATHNKKDFLKLHGEYMVSSKTHYGIIPASGNRITTKSHHNY
ncbi:MAG: DUF5615 family PIN-like protein [Acidobacteria bacterium]|nr:DUF5615 family PIN-like protein [Acidobacteriota bacterium]MBI3658364.1 DUF5615 family PIN-like protein [Acidobacteriota bacterium]